MFDFVSSLKFQSESDDVSDQAARADSPAHMTDADMEAAMDICSICRDDGKLIPCGKKCGHSYHVDCLGIFGADAYASKSDAKRRELREDYLIYLIADDWSCPDCFVFENFELQKCR